MQSKLKNAGLCLAGIVLGCAGASMRPTTIAHAEDPGWRCYATDMLEDPADAAAWRGAEAATKGLNQVAQRTPSGTVVNLQWNQATSVTCVKN